VSLDQFHVGQQYDVGNAFAALFLAEGWAVPVDDGRSAIVIPLDERPTDASASVPSNLVRETHPPYYDGPALAADRRRRPRHK
jgi:hypothetical protein